MFRWYRPVVQLLKWGAAGTAWARPTGRWELRGYREFMEFVAACMPEGAQLDEDGRIFAVSDDGKKSYYVSRNASMRELFRNLDRFGVKPNDCIRFAPLIRTCELSLPATSWAEVATPVSVQSMFDDFRAQTLPIGEVVDTWSLYGAWPLYVSLTKALGEGASVGYLRDLAFPFDEDEWYIAQRLCGLAAGAEEHGLPALWVRDMFTGLLRVTTPTVEELIRMRQAGVSVEYLRAGISVGLSVSSTMKAWEEGIVAEYLVPMETMPS